MVSRAEFTPLAALRSEEGLLSVYLNIAPRYPMAAFKSSLARASVSSWQPSSAPFWSAKRSRPAVLGHLVPDGGRLGALRLSACRSLGSGVPERQGAESGKCRSVEHAFLDGACIETVFGEAKERLVAEGGLGAVYAIREQMRGIMKNAIVRVEK